MKETQIQSDICDYLELRRHFFTRVNTVGVFDSARGIHRRPSRHNKRGMSDILVVHVGVPYFLEVKTPVGRQSPDQKDFQEQVEKAGGVYAVVRSIPDVQALGL
jgi:VRR-NUC domain